MTDAPALPDYLAGASVCAHVEHGRRRISWTITEPGCIHRNAFTWAHIELSEGTGWTGEPLHVWANRRTGDSRERVPFTDAARSQMQSDIAPAVARFGFDRLWLDLSRATMGCYSADEARAAAAEAREVAEWFDRKAALIELHHMGLTEFRPVRHEVGTQPVRVRVHGPHSRPITSEVVAEVRVGDERVGWVLPGGEMVPSNGEPHW